MKNRFKLIVTISALLLGGFFLFPLSGIAQERRIERLEDLSRYYTPKYKDPNVYSVEPGEKKSLYLQGQPSLPQALEQPSINPRREWSRPEQLSSPQDFYRPPTDLFLPFTSIEKEKKVEIELETKEGKVSSEAFAERLKPIIESITGKTPQLTLLSEEPALVKPIAPLQEEEESEPAEPPETNKKNQWKLLLTKGRISLKPPTGTSEKDLQEIAAYLVDLLGRGGEITMLGPEGIEIKVR